MKLHIKTAIKPGKYIVWDCENTFRPFSGLIYLFFRHVSSKVLPDKMENKINKSISFPSQHYTQKVKGQKFPFNNFQKTPYNDKERPRKN